jgi:metal-responsive CopG/Arc/MetJ family transcriptional regulator
MAKTHTSWQVKQKYNSKVYSRIGVQLPKDLVTAFKEKCVELGISQASVIKEAIEKFLAEN